jgi:ketosteroid isomerase-like protein
MDAQANTALVLETFAAFNAGDLDSCLARMTPDFVMHYAELPEPLHGTETWLQGAEMMRRAFPDLEVRVDDVVAAEDRVALRPLCMGRTGETSIWESSRPSPPPAGRSSTSATSSIGSVTA